MAERARSEGVFITLEGPDGAGKSTQAQALSTRLRERTGRDVQVRREPGGTELGERIRGLLLSSERVERDPLSDALLFNAARRLLVAIDIRPALERGAVVICDRYTDSTLAYQGYGSGVPLDDLRVLAEVATSGLKPARTVLIDVNPDDGLARRSTGETSELTRFETDEAHGASFHERVRDGFLELARLEPGRWRVVDGSRTHDEVADDVWAAVADLFAR
jgi:dTMP kinase